LWAMEVVRPRSPADNVTAILGTGHRDQFQFQGIISSQKPFRDC